MLTMKAEIRNQVIESLSLLTVGNIVRLEYLFSALSLSVKHQKRLLVSRNSALLVSVVVYIMATYIVMLIN